MKFKIKLLEINDMGKYYFPQRAYKRVSRYLQRLAKYLHNYHLNQKHNKPIVKFLNEVYYSFLNCWYGLNSNQKNMDDDIENKVDKSIDNDDLVSIDSDNKSEFSNSSYLTIKLDKKMKKHVTRSVVAGTKHLWGYRPDSNNINRRKRLKKEKVAKKKIGPLRRKKEMQLQKNELKSSS